METGVKHNNAKNQCFLLFTNQYKNSKFQTVKRNTEMEADAAKFFMLKYNNSPKPSFLNEFLFFPIQHLGPQK